jgi:peptidoglycan/LPS O-acetylase OafA/YrhL/lysophospholipase L1-like esterase
MPGLDGLRAIAVLTVIAFHEQFSWAPGGLLGVGVFFTLSGYLITDLLLGRWTATGRLHLADFWIRRARRLLPALFVMLVVVTAWVTVADRVRLGSLRGAVAAAATYSSNWYLIGVNQSYFARFAPPEPLDHLWSLAVEEQFYLLWPWLLLLGLLCIRRRGADGVAWLAIPTLALATASAIAMYVLYQPGVDPTRVYEGTDTRAAGLLIGAALAMLWPSSRAGKTARKTGWLLDMPALAGLAVIVLMTWRIGQYSPFLYQGGMVLLSLATAAAVAAAACPGSIVGAALGVAPLRWIGVRSYGIYLWHYPVIVLTSAANAPEDLPRAAAQVAATVVLAALSWRFVEEPVRRGAIARAWRRLRERRVARPGLPRVAAAAAAAGVVAIACTGMAGVGGIPVSTSTAAVAGGSGGLSAVTHSVSGTGSVGGAGQSGAGRQGKRACQHTAGTRGRCAETPSPSPTIVEPWTLRTSCTSVAHIGDSTSDGLVSPDYLPDPADRIQARYEDVGVQTVDTDIVGARSVVETLPGTTNGQQAAQNLVSHGFHGCWVIALGTNDTADIAVGSNVALASRISEMMQLAQGEPVMWVNVISLLSTGPYSEADMQKWNDALAQACTRYPNMRVFNWAALPVPSWFISDGIHYTSAGYYERALYLADGLAMAFPHTGASKGCLVSLPASVTSPSPSPSPSTSTPATSVTPVPSSQPATRPATAAQP